MDNNDTDLSRISKFYDNFLQECDREQQYIEKWMESLRYVRLLDKSKLIQIHENIENDIYDDPIIFDIIIQSLIEQYYL